MKGWLAANLFLLAMALVSAAILFGGHVAIRSYDLTERTQQTLTGALAVFALVATGVLSRAVLRRIERRR